MINVMNTTKKKAGAAILCGALALTLGTGATTTFAAEGKMDSLMAKNENGVITYSTDGGQTWSEKAPANMQAVKMGEGNMMIKNKLASEGGIKAKVMVKEENGTKLYSTDDGQTWSETAPEGDAGLRHGRRRKHLIQNERRLGRRNQNQSDGQGGKRHEAVLYG
ncbi:glycoside hydrolase [Paenibacillus thiaminolyticus]|nr:glycoside hydrolase [Paenibacillus thiaminolyticus]